MVLFLVLFLSGCYVRPRGIQQVGNWGPVTMLEDGIPVRLYTMQMADYRGSALVYDTNQLTYSAIFSEKSTGMSANQDQAEARRLWTTAPAWRREELLLAVAARLTAEEPPELERFLISSHGPVVIAMTGQRNEYRDGYLHFFREYGVDHKIQRLYIYHGWPIPDAKLGLLTDREILVLKTPMYIEDVLDTRPWEHSPK